MVSLEDILRTKLTLQAEKEYVQKLFKKLQDAMSDVQFEVVIPKKETLALFWLVDKDTSTKRSCLVQRRLKTTYDLRHLEYVVNWLIENATILRRIVDPITFPSRITLFHISEPESYIPGYITVANKETHSNVSYYVKDNAIVSISSNLKLSSPDTDTILEITNTLLQL